MTNNPTDPGGLEAARRDLWVVVESYSKLIAIGNDVDRAIAVLESAARLAGRLEQASRSLDLVRYRIGDGVGMIERAISEERDRLRREAKEPR